MEKVAPEFRQTLWKLNAFFGHAKIPSPGEERSLE